MLKAEYAKGGILQKRRYHFLQRIHAKAVIFRGKYLCCIILIVIL